MPNSKAKKPAKKLTINAVLNKLIERVNADRRRLKILEQESSASKSRIISAEENLIEQRKDINIMIKDLDEDLMNLEDRMSKIEITMKEIVKEIKSSSKDTKMQELENLIEVFNPLKSNFITREEVERLIEEKVQNINRS